MSTAVAVASSTRFRSVEVAIAWFGVAIVLFGAVLWTNHSPANEMTDFSVTYIGARIVHEGRGSNLYDVAEQEKTKASVFTHAQPLIFEHPPFEALLLAPLGGLHYDTAYLIWGTLNVLVWLYLPYLLRPYAPCPHSELAYLMLWLLFPPLGIALYQGQSSLLLLLVFALAFVSLKRGREFKAGVWLGLGLFKFQFAIPLALIFLFRRKWNVVSGFVASAIALALLSFVAVGWQGLVGYVRLLLNVAGHPHNSSYGEAKDMATLQAFCNAVLGGLLTPAAIHFTVAAGSAALIVSAARASLPDITHARFDLLFAISILVALITGIHMFAHDLSPLALALFVVLPHLASRAARGWSGVARVCIVLLWIPLIYFLAVAGHALYLFFPLLSLLAISITQLREGTDPLSGIRVA
jgi:glycosyl transferase family 87